jgi:hypothetical protein
VAGVGFAPGITLQSAPGPDGKAPVLFRFAVYRGPERLAAALRKADPNYQPERDPDPGTPTPDSPKPDPSGPPGIPPSGWAILGGLAGWIAFQRRDER